ncbi:ABC transporter substrate-binding protein [Arenibaculum sp.]|uniref:ABC transporter substrate-binding protein n=1 Tax=Arenibaculum sp. TaxID=2865862 RepID=UPI0039C8AF89
MKMLSLAAATAALAVLATPAFAQTKSVAVTAIVEHPALDAARDGVRDALKDAGFREGENLQFSYQSAQGNPATAAQIARQLVGDRPDVIVPISTPSAQAVVAATRDIPVVFTAVTDPLGAQLVTDMEKPGGNVTGLSDMSPLAEHLALIKEITPDAKRIGIPYNPGEPNSVTVVNMMKEMAQEQGLEIVEATATRSADVQAAARSLVGRADVMYIPLDNTIVSALEGVVSVADQNDIPVYAADTASVDRGAFAAVGFNYYDVGRQTGEVVARILKGENAGDIPVRVAAGTDLVVNPAAAEAQGVKLPEAVVSRATKVIGQ